MSRIALLATAAIMFASPAFAANGCSTADASKFKPEADLKVQIEKDGLSVRQIKTEKGCYEVYAVDKTGKKVNVAYNAETFAKVANPEAGEN